MGGAGGQRINKRSLEGLFGSYLLGTSWYLCPCLGSVWVLVCLTRFNWHLIATLCIFHTEHFCSSVCFSDPIISGEVSSLMACSFNCAVCFNTEAFTEFWNKHFIRLCFAMSPQLRLIFSLFEQHLSQIISL